MPKHRVHVTTPEHFDDTERKTLQKEFKSATVGILRRQRGNAWDPSIDNIETTTARRPKRRRKKPAPAKKSRKAAKK